MSFCALPLVVLLAEDVDRNSALAVLEELKIVVLLAEDVDRNPTGTQLVNTYTESSSLRRTWIEIGLLPSG